MTARILNDLDGSAWQKLAQSLRPMVLPTMIVAAKKLCGPTRPRSRNLLRGSPPQAALPWMSALKLSLRHMRWNLTWRHSTCTNAEKKRGRCGAGPGCSTMISQGPSAGTIAIIAVQALPQEVADDPWRTVAANMEDAWVRVGAQWRQRSPRPVGRGPSWSICSSRIHLRIHSHRWVIRAFGGSCFSESIRNANPAAAAPLEIERREARLGMRCAISGSSSTTH